MKKYIISYFYLATGMEGVADFLPETTITAESRDKAIWEYWKMHNHRMAGNSFEEFLAKPKHHQDWGISCQEIN